MGHARSASRRSAASSWRSRRSSWRAASLPGRRSRACPDDVSVADNPERYVLDRRRGGPAAPVPDADPGASVLIGGRVPDARPWSPGPRARRGGPARARAATRRRRRSPCVQGPEVCGEPDRPGDPIAPAPEGEPGESSSPEVPSAEADATRRPVSTRRARSEASVRPTSADQSGGHRDGGVPGPGLRPGHDRQAG